MLVRLTRSTIPTKPASLPIGSWMGIGLAPSRSLIDCSEA